MMKYVKYDYQDSYWCIYPLDNVPKGVEMGNGYRNIGGFAGPLITITAPETLEMEAAMRLIANSIDEAIDLFVKS
jgi:hypothetical protein